MSKRVLNVGQCGPDTASLTHCITSNFDAELIPAATTDEALEKLRSESFDLVLVNRKLDADYTDGTILISRMQADPDINTTPIMLVSNFAESQEEAVEMGAEYGFGKAELDKSETIERLGKFLG